MLLDCGCLPGKWVRWGGFGAVPAGTSSGVRQGRALPGPLLDLTSTVVVSISNAMVSYSTFSEMRVITGIICI